LKWKKEHSADNYSTIKNESEHDIEIKKFLDILHHDLFENKQADKKKMKITSLLLHIMYIKDLQDKCD
jgi:hypothetical protein